MFKIVTAAAALVLAAAAPAFAANNMTATLETAVTKPSTVVAAGVVWKCMGTACATTSDISTAGAKNSCRKLVREVGKVSAFNSPKGALSAEDLAACND